MSIQMPAQMFTATEGLSTLRTVQRDGGAVARRRHLEWKGEEEKGGGVRQLEVLECCGVCGEGSAEERVALHDMKH